VRLCYFGYYYNYHQYTVRQGIGERAALSAIEIGLGFDSYSLLRGPLAIDSI
jgi:hypothetical protein